MTRISLRWKILLLAVLTPLTLGLATFVTVHRNVNDHVNSSSIHESLSHSVSVFESMLETRSRALAGGGQVIARDPRFFSLLMLGTSQRDYRFVATVKGMASDFNRITQTDLFEVVDRHGRLLASVGAAASHVDGRTPMVRTALRGTPVEGILSANGLHYQVALTPVSADGRVVGVLLLGARIGESLATQLRSQMYCEVTFFSDSKVTGTTLSKPGDLAALAKCVETMAIKPSDDLSKLGVIQVKGGHDVYLTLVRRIPESDAGTAQLYVLQRSFDPETSFLHLMQKDMFLLAALAFLIALLSGWVFSEQILRPVQNLVRGAHEMERGNYEHPVEVRRGDELGYLAERFVEMRRREQAYVSSLEQTARLKSQFISGTSHELRTPISVLGGYRDLLASGNLGPVSPKQAEVLKAMGDYLAKLTQVAEDATQVSQMKGERLVLTFEACAVEPIVRRAVGAALAEGATRKVKVDVECRRLEAPAEVDGASLAKAIAHLVSNAIRFTPDGGRVEVAAFVRDQRLRIEVRDSGVGIAEDRLHALLTDDIPAPKLQDAQASSGLDFKSSGLGLGLSIARAIAEAHGGTLTAESREGQGSLFVLDLPVTREEQKRAAA